MGQRVRKLKTIHKVLHPKEDVEELYVSRKGGRGIASIEDIDDASIKRYKNYIQKRGGRLITATLNNIDDTRTHRTTINR